MVKPSRSPSWFRLFLAFHTFVAIMLFVAVFVPSLPCANCTRTDRTKAFMITSSRCLFCLYDRKVSPIDAQLNACSMIMNGGASLLVPIPGDPEFPKQLLAFLGFPITGLFLFAGIIFLGTRIPIVECSQCPDTERKPVDCPRCRGTGNVSLYRIWIHRKTSANL
jgi:hypothetical protein